MFKYAKRNDGNRCDEDIEEYHVPIVVNGLPREARDSLEVEEGQAECYVFVEEIAYLNR